MEKMEFLPIEIEEVDEEALKAEELSEFVKTETIKIQSSGQIREISQQEDQELIKKLIEGQLTFSDYNELIQGDEVEISDEEDDEQPSTSKDPGGDIDLDKIGKHVFHDKKIRRSILPKNLQGLMGEANLKYVRGDVEMAEKLCLEIIRQMPLAVEPFQTLAQIYEGRDPQKYMQFMLIAGHLNPGDHDHWLNLADVCLDAGNTRQAVICYSRAIKANPRDLDIRLRRLEIVEAMGDERFALVCRLNLLPYIPLSDRETLMSMAINVAKKYHQEGKLDKAILAMKRVHHRSPEIFTTEDLNMYIDLLMESKEYLSVIQLFKLHSGVGVWYDGFNKMQITIPDDIIMDFRTKLFVCLIESKQFHLIEKLMKNVFEFMDVELDGDCYLDVAEALMHVQRYEDAISLLERLLDSQNFSLAAVWLRHADCLRLVNRIDEAIESYKRVVALAPQHLDARLTLSALLKQKQKHQEALKALEQDLESDLLDPTLLYEHCFMLKETGNIDQYIDLSIVLFSRHCIKFRDREELEVSLHHLRIQRKWGAVRELRELRLENIDDQEGPEFTKETDEPPLETEWNLFKDVITECFKLKRFDSMHKLSISAITSKRFATFSKEIHFKCLVSSIHNRDFQVGYSLIKEMFSKDLQNRRFWNLLNVFYQFCLDTKHFRHLTRMISKEQVDPMINWLSANYYLTAGSYSFALTEYYKLFKLSQNALIALLIAIVLKNCACQKYSNPKSDSLNQAITFLAQYESLREPEAAHEVYYNCGRFYQHIGLLPLAMEYYNKVLKFNNNFTDRYPELVGLKQEAAFNLHLIYKNSGNMEMARKILYDYIQI